MTGKIKTFIVISAIIALFGALFSASAQAATKLVVSAAAVPHTELLEFVKPKLAEQGIDLEIVTIDEAVGGTLLNEQTDNGENDANFFQHVPYLNSIIAEKGFDLAPAGNIHVEPIGFYSTKYKSRDEIPANAKIAIPFDATNEYRALKILENNGFIKLSPGIVNFTATKQDIAEYIGVSAIEELEAGLVIRLGDQFDGYISNTNRILEAGIDANTALFREDKDSPYANVLVTKSSRVNDPAVVALKNALQTDEVRKFIEEKYKGAVVPAF
jgi:D-methionine transport system substrate-binding protein